MPGCGRLLRMHGVAPEMALPQVDARLLDEQSGSDCQRTSARKEKFVLAAGRVMSQNMLLLKLLRSEEHHRALHSDLRRLAALYKQMHLASRDPSNGPTDRELKNEAERLMHSAGRQPRGHPGGDLPHQLRE